MNHSKQIYAHMLDLIIGIIIVIIVKLIIRQGARMETTAVLVQQTGKVTKNRKRGERNVGFPGFHSPATQAETCCRPSLMKD